MTRARAPGNWGTGRRRKNVSVSTFHKDRAHPNDTGTRLLIGILLGKAKQSRHKESWTQPRPFSGGLM